MSLLQVTNLTKTFSRGILPFSQKKYTAVNNISFELNQGEILGFLGTNGAGKSTTIHMLLGLLKPTSGAITYFGKDFYQNSHTVLKRISYASGFDKLPARLTIWENLDIVARIYNLNKSERKERIKQLLQHFGIWDLADKPTGMLSSGQSTKVTLIKAFLAKPEIVLLDEPSAALDPESAEIVQSFVLEQNKQHGVSILFTSHNMNEVTQVCDRVLILKQGSIIANNTPEELARSVSKSRIHIMIDKGFSDLLIFLEQEKINHIVGEHEITIEIDEKNIALFLQELAKRSISYSQISIDKPTLQDYFLSIAKK